MRARRTQAIVLERMADDPVVLLEGPRSVGKSTLLKEVTAACGGRLLDLDDPATRDAVTADPARFVAGDISQICRGGFPLAIAASSERARKRWIDEYVRLTLERDVRELSRLRQGHLLGTLLGRLAGQTAQVLNIEKAARDVGLDRATTESYVSLLEKVFLIHRLPAWGKTLTARSAATPKIHVLDSAVAARLLRLTPDKLSTLDPTAQTEFGHLLETFAVGELLKHASWNDDIAGVGHWRTHDGDEVDFVAELDDGGVVGFEVKTGSRVLGGDLRPLRKLRDAVGQNFVAGFALYLGERSYTYDDRLHVVPLDRLWRPSGIR